MLSHRGAMPRPGEGHAVPDQFRQRMDKLIVAAAFDLVIETPVSAPNRSAPATQIR